MSKKEDGYVGPQKLLGELTAYIDGAHFPTDTDIQQKHNEVMLAARAFSAVIRDLDTLVRSRQHECTHPRMIVERSRREIRGGVHSFTAEVLDKKYCPDCHLLQKKPDSPPSEMCEVCWSPMELVTEPEKEEGASPRFRCSNIPCKHEIRVLGSPAR